MLTSNMGAHTKIWKWQREKKNTPRALNALYGPFFVITLFHLPPCHVSCRLQPVYVNKTLVSIKRKQRKKKKNSPRAHTTPSTLHSSIESMWTPQLHIDSTQTPCGLHVESTWSPKNGKFFLIGSQRTPCGVHVESMWSLCGVYVESI